jgi:hypothetical protein
VPAAIHDRHHHEGEQEGADRDRLEAPVRPLERAGSARGQAAAAEKLGQGGRDDRGESDWLEHLFDAADGVEPPL